MTTVLLSPQHSLMYGRRIRVRDGTLGRDGPVEDGCQIGRKSCDAGGCHFTSKRKGITMRVGTGGWRERRRVMEIMGTATEIFEETRVNYWPVRLCDVLQAETWIWQNIDFNIYCGDLSNGLVSSVMDHTPWGKK